MTPQPGYVALIVIGILILVFVICFIKIMAACLWMFFSSLVDTLKQAKRYFGYAHGIGWGRAINHSLQALLAWATFASIFCLMPILAVLFPLFLFFFKK